MLSSADIFPSFISLLKNGVDGLGNSSAGLNTDHRFGGRWESWNHECSGGRKFWRLLQPAASGDAFFALT